MLVRIWLGLWLLLAVAVNASAVTVRFDCLSTVNAANCQAGEQQFSVDVGAAGANQINFTFKNQGPAASSISEIYFQGGPFTGSISLVDKDQGTGGLTGVDFTAGSATPPNLPGANLANPPFVVTAGFLADADSPPSKNGINPGEWLGMIFTLQNGASLNQVVQQFQTGQLRIGMHAIAFANGGSESFINMPLSVPVPAALWLLASGCFAMLAAGRRK